MRFPSNFHVRAYSVDIDIEVDVHNDFDFYDYVGSTILGWNLLKIWNRSLFVFVYPNLRLKCLLRLSAQSSPSYIIYYNIDIER